MRITKPRSGRLVCRQKDAYPRLKRQLEEERHIHFVAGKVIKLMVILDEDPTCQLLPEHFMQMRSRLGYCFCCDSPVGEIVAFIVATLNPDDTSPLICGIVCPGCNGGRERIAQQAIAALCRKIDPSICGVTVH